MMISHDNVTWVVASFARLAGFGTAPGGRERIVSFLPLSHIAAQAIDIYAGLVCVGRRVVPGAEHVHSSTLYFARPDALKGSLKGTLVSVRPTIFFGVPRVWEKFAEALQAVGAKTTGVKKIISTWAKGAALRQYAAVWIPRKRWATSRRLVEEERTLETCRFHSTSPGTAPTVPT